MEFKNYITEVFDGAYKLLVMYNAQEKLHPKWIEKIYYSNEWMNECHRSACVCGLASSPGHPRFYLAADFLHSCEIKSGSGLGMRLYVGNQDPILY